MTDEQIIEMAKEAGLHVANDSEGHFSGVTNEEMIDMYPDPDKERDRLFREKIFIEVLAPFAKLVAQHERERIFGELLKMHEIASSRHNYYLHAVLTIRARGEA